MTLRLYTKVYDKLTRNLDPEQGQFTEGEPNILLTCFVGLGMRADHPGVRWGFEELFVSHPAIARRVVPESFTDISLEAWTDFRVKELISQKLMTVDWYCENSSRVLGAPQRLGGALLFDSSKLSSARINYAASDDSLVSHGAMADLENLFSGHASYFH
jgi:hypothetical protein